MWPERLKPDLRVCVVELFSRTPPLAAGSFLGNRQLSAQGWTKHLLKDQISIWVQHDDGTVAPYWNGELQELPTTLSPPQPDPAAWGGSPLGDPS